MTSGSLSTTTTYTYEGLSLLALAAQRSDGATWSIDYLLDASARPYAAIYAASDAAPMVVGMVTTARGDVAELVDETGAAFALYRTDAYGAPVEVSACAAGSVPATLAAAIASRNPVRYAGYCFDEHSQLYYLSQRYYDPASRQFLSKDPARADGEESAYQYCGGDPVGKVDPSGLWAAVVHFHTYPEDQWNRMFEVMRTNAGYAFERARYYLSRFGMVGGLVQWAGWFRGVVASGRSWDFKADVPTGHQSQAVFRFGGRRISLEQFGNMHYGYVLASVMWPRSAAQLCATAAALASSPSLATLQHERYDNAWIGYGWDAFVARANSGYVVRVYRAAAASTPNMYVRGYSLYGWWLIA